LRHVGRRRRGENTAAESSHRKYKRKMEARDALCFTRFSERKKLITKTRGVIIKGGQLAKTIKPIFSIIICFPFINDLFSAGKPTLQNRQLSKNSPLCAWCTNLLLVHAKCHHNLRISCTEAQD